MPAIRLMREDDVEVVRRVHAEAFGAWQRQSRGEHTALPLHTRTSVLARLEKDPDGCFVADEHGRPVGFIFSRTWGGVGWFGAFAVLPAYQGRGIGKRLIAASLAYLRRDPDRLVGLETMPESAYNLGLYLRQGFQVRMLTFLLSTSLDQSTADGVDLPCWSSADAGVREHWLADLRKATGHIYPGLDYSKEIATTARYDLGKTLVLVDGARAVGMSTVRLVSDQEGGGDELAHIHVAALHPEHTDEGTFHALLGTTAALARARGKQKLMVWVNNRHTWALERLLAWGYRIERTMVRLVLKGTNDDVTTDGYVDLCRWAG